MLLSTRYLLLIALLSALLSTHHSLIQAESISNQTKYPAFCQQAADNDDVFRDFKRNPTYQEILEHVSYEHGLEYLNIILRDYPKIITRMENCRENDILGNPITYNYGEFGFFSPTTLRYIKVAADLLKHFDHLENMHIVEIGGGYGGQCKIIADLCGFASYTIIDLPQSNALAQKYLQALGIQNVHFMNNNALNKEKSFDLVISNYAFSEIDQNEQQSQMKDILQSVPNGYMTLNFISDHFNLTSLSIDQLVTFLLKNKRIGKVQAEAPKTHRDNLILTWHTDTKISRVVETLPTLTPSSQWQSGNAITYGLSGGRLGDNLLAYFHAKWMSYKYGLPLLYKPFPYSDQFCLHDRDQAEGKDFSFQLTIPFTHENDLKKLTPSSLVFIPYFPETWAEYEWVQLFFLPFYSVDWEDPNFHREVVKCLQPKNPITLPKLPSKAITVAMHIRRADEGEQAKIMWPLKFVDDEFYIEQLQRIVQFFPDKKIYVRLFTDYPHPKSMVEKYKTILKNPNISFAYKTNTDMLEDFYAISKFDCCIISQSNFSLMAAKLGEYALLIMPVHAVMKNNVPVIDEIEMHFNGQKKRKKS